MVENYVLVGVIGMTRYVIYFEPVDIDAKDIAEAKQILHFYRILPTISKIVPAKLIFDYDEKEAPELSK